MTFSRLIAGVVLLPACWGQAAWEHEFGGYNKMLFRSAPAADLMNRLRLTYDAHHGEWFEAHIDLDNQAHFGNLIEKPEFDLVRRRQEGSWWDLHRINADRRHAYWDTSLYRGSVTLRSSRAALTLGRQRIGWGTARFWSPADVFNPLNPLAIEDQEREGVDAAYLELRLPRGVRWSTAGSRGTGATRLATTWRGYDLAAFGGRFAGDWMSGGELAGQWSGAGLRGEATYEWRDEVLRLTAGADYAFANTLYLVGEYFYNQGQPDTLDPSALYRFASRIFTLNRHFLSGGATYDITPLFRVEAYSVVDVAGPSLFVMPRATYNLTPNTDLAVGAQLFSSTKGGEFETLSDALFVELAVHF